jgi:predicted transcriptional regulator
MTTLEIKSDLQKRINSLGRNKLNEVKGYLENLEQEDVELIDWLNLSIEHRNRMNESIAQLDAGRFTPHDKVMKELRKIVKNA